MNITLQLLNVKEEEVIRVKIDSDNLANVNNIVHNGNHYAYSAISHRTNLITYRQVCKPVQLNALPILEVEVMR